MFVMLLAFEDIFGLRQEDSSSGCDGVKLRVKN